MVIESSCNLMNSDHTESVFCRCESLCIYMNVSCHYSELWLDRVRPVFAYRWKFQLVKSKFRTFRYVKYASCIAITFLNTLAVLVINLKRKMLTS